MDWSLVLVSQGIETSIEFSEDGAGWGLLVTTQDYQNALDAIQQYRLENRGWPWQQRILRPGFLFDWGSLAWILLLLFFFLLDAHVNLRAPGLMVGIDVTHGQWWRLFTAIWLHADLGHLASNATFGFLLLGLVMGRYGTGTGVLAAYLAGAGGNVVVWLISSDQHGHLGASGMVMAGLGLLAVQSFSLWRRTPRAPKYILSSMVGGIMLFLLLGSSPGTDLVAHLGGFICGLLFGGLLTLVSAIAQKPGVNLIAAFLFAVLVIVPWLLALRTQGSFH